MKLLKNTIIYSALGYLDQAISFLLLPVFTAYLLPADYGIIGLVSALSLFLQNFFVLGGNNVLMRQYHGEWRKRGLLAEAWGTTLCFQMLVAFTLTVLLILTHQWTIKPFLRDVDFWPCIFLGLISAAALPVRKFYEASLQTREKGTAFMWRGLGYTALRVTCALIFITGFHLKAAGMLLALATADVVFAFVGLWFLRNEIKPGLRIDVLKDSMGYALPVIPHHLAGWATTYLGVFVLNAHASTTEVGLYSVATRITMLLALITTGFTSAFYPQVFAALGDPEKKGVRSVRSKGALAASMYCVAAIALALFAPEVMRIMAKKTFWPAAQVVPLLLVGVLAQGFFHFYANVLYYHKEGTRFLPVSSFVSAGCSLAAMWLLIPRYGAYGAALAVAIGVFIRLTMVSTFVNARFEVPYSQSMMALFLALGYLGLGGAWLLNKVSFEFWSGIALKSALLTAVVLLFVSLNLPNLRRLLGGKAPSCNSGSTPAV